MRTWLREGRGLLFSFVSHLNTSLKYGYKGKKRQGNDAGVGAWALIKGEAMNKYNDSHCLDLTPKQAVENIERKRKEALIDKRAKELLSALVHMIDLAGFHLEGHIEVTHRRTGRKYR